MLQTTTATLRVTECVACGATFATARRDVICYDCTDPLTFNGRAWADITAATHAAMPETRRIPHIYAERPAAQ